MSNPTHYSGPELGALLAQVREELGEDATIHEANKVRSGGVGGFFAKESFEISASHSDYEGLGHSAIDLEPMDLGFIDDDIFDPDISDLDISDLNGSGTVETGLEAEAEPELPLLDVIGDLADTLPHSATAPSNRPEPVTALVRETVAPPARITEKPALTFDFGRLGPLAIPARLETSEPRSARTPVPTPGPLRSLEPAASPSTTVGELVADALMERAELVNALEHLEITDQMIASQQDGSQPSVPILSDESFDEILRNTLADPYLEDTATESTDDADQTVTEEVVAEETLTEEIVVTTAEAVSQRIAAQGDVASKTQANDAVLVEPESELPQLPAPTPPQEQTQQSPTPREPSGNRERPDFWTRMALAREEILLYQLPRTKVTAVVGPLDLALPVARRFQQDEWIGTEDLAVLSSRTSVPGLPSWQAVARLDDLHWAMDEWCATQRRGIVIVDTHDLQTDNLFATIAQLRSHGADMIRISLPSEFEILAFIEMAEKIGGPLAVDLPKGTAPADILAILDQGLSVGSVGGSPLTAALLVALRSEANGN